MANGNRIADKKGGEAMENNVCYQLMYKDEVIINFNQAALNNYEIIKKERLPMGIKNGMSLEQWLKQRTADKSRVSIRKLFATLKMNFGNDKYISQFRKPTDFYWIRKKDSDEIFDAPVENLYQISLNLASVVPKNPRNFETTNIGSYEKGWREGKLVKMGNKHEIFSEILYSKISEKYMKTAKYFLEEIAGKAFVVSPNFVSLSAGEFLVLADEWTGSGAEEDFEGWFASFGEQLCEQELEDLSVMHFLDVVMNNFDRHCQNFGFIYNEKRQRFVAPNFDFNLAIIGYNGLDNLGHNELSLNEYFKLFEQIPSKLKTVPRISDIQEEITSICQSLNLEAEKYMKVATWIVTRWEQLLQMEKM